MEQKIIRERYKIIEEIARGGMGVVYLAKDLLTNHQVALKTSLGRRTKIARRV